MLGRGRKVMIVEDDLAMQSLLTDFLALQGFEAKGFRLATQALSHLQDVTSQGDTEATYDLIISDINMPQMNGLEFVDSVKRMAPDTPVVLVTAFGSAATQATAQAMGASAYLNKPFKLSDLKEVVGRLLSQAG